MRLMKCLGFKNKSAETAKNRLQIIIAQQRAHHGTSPDYLPLLRQDIIDVITKYTQVDKDQIQVDWQTLDNDRAILELNVTLPNDN